MVATMCIQCAMKALLQDKPSPVFEHSPEEHRRRYHADPVATEKERRELEEKLSIKLGG
jgi:hypothetical protein